MPERDLSADMLKHVFELLTTLHTCAGGFVPLVITITPGGF